MFDLALLARASPARTYLVVIGCGLVLRLALSWSALQDPQRHQNLDSQQYLRLSHNLVAGHGFSLDAHPPYRPSFFRVPGYPLFLGALALLPIGSSAVAAVVLSGQCLMWCGQAAVMWRLCNRIGVSPRSTTVSLAIMAFDPLSVALSALILSDTLFVLAEMLWLIALATLLHRGGSGHALRAGALAGLMALIRPVATYLWIVNVVLVFAVRRESRERWRLCAWLAAGTLLTVSPWILRNRVHFEAWAISSNADSQLLFANAAVAEAVATGRSFAVVSEEYQERWPRYRHEGVEPNRIHGAATRQGLSILRTYPGGALEGALRSWISLYFEPGQYWINRALGREGLGLRDVDRGSLTMAVRARPLAALILLWTAGWLAVVDGLALAGAYRSLTARRSAVAIGLATLAYFTLLSTHAAVFEGGRYRLPIVPALALLAGLGTERNRPKAGARPVNAGV